MVISIKATALIVSLSFQGYDTVETAFSFSFSATYNDRIIGGSFTTIDKYPFGVSLQQHLWDGSYLQMCGGSILNSRSILSAANCFDIWRAPDMWRGRVGSTWANGGGSVFYTKSIIMHPNYDFQTSDNDFAIIRLVDNIKWSKTIQPAHIAGVNYNFCGNEVVWAIGWGYTAPNGFPSEQLRHAQIWTINQDFCSQRLKEITDNMLCSGWQNVGGRGQCALDIGGPVVHNNVVVGVNSFHRNCASPFYPGVSARVSSASQWITDNA